MKKITLLFLMLFSAVYTFAQLQVGVGDTQSTLMPIDPYFGYSYSQSIYSAQEINTSGTITGIQYYFSGTSLLPNSQDLVVYIGHTTKAEFEDTSDWVDVTTLTASYAGGIAVVGEGWVTLTLDTPFAYNGTDNLVIAIDENMTGFDSSGDDFWNSATSSARSIGYRNDTNNPDPIAPPTASGTYSFVPTIIFDGLVATLPPNCDAMLTEPVDGATDASLIGDISWSTATGAPTDYLLTVGTTVGGTEVFTGQVGNVTTYNIGVLNESTTYYVNITPSNSNGMAAGCTEYSFTTLTPLPGDSLSDPIAFTPSIEGSTCDTSNYTFSYDFSSGYTDSGLDGTCNTTNTGQDIFLSWTSTSDALIWNDGGGNPGVIIRDASTGNEITCATTFASNDYVLSGWTLGQDLIIQVYDYGTQDVNPLSFCLAEYNLPANPDCAENVMATPNSTCGSFSTILTWDAVVEAEGYNLTVGTTSGGNDILDDVNLGDVVTYEIDNQTSSTTYYYTLSPYNISGPAIDCVENTYTTIAAMCYCESVPSSIDGSGIGNLQVGTTDFVSAGDVSYEDFTGAPVDLGQGISANVVITFMTNYTYGTNIWIDYNDDFVFDASELMYTGESPDGDTGTDILDASFMVSETATLGIHRMRIVTDDTNSDATDPCNSSSYGVTMDVDVNIIEVTCAPPAGSVTVVADCANFEFYIDIDVTDLGNDSPSIFDGTTTTPVTSLGVYTVGPYTDGSSVALTLQNGSDAACDVSLGNFTNICPPINDDCANATTITQFDNGDTQDATNATNNDGFIIETGCGSANDGVWYTFKIGDAGTIDVTISNIIGWDSEITVLTGDCGAFTCVGNSDSGFTGGDESYSFSATAGTQYWVNVAHYSGTADNAEGPFTINVSTPDTATLDVSLSTEDFEKESLFTYYPNPVNNSLNLKAQKEISNVSVYNMLGQEVYRNSPNSFNNTVDMANLDSGAYFVKVTINDATETIKIIKN
ncbi:T9SS type A sorting domain-containing protein [uncultured Olleya sp.]|uniref:T9SS type A sorting domain-containing protein n=1 Tax=uncultured Olleya sp. TaxID=757243 RepID=UPI0025956162|nr:T9SS type A sorting domain-containing protein [uncultured Olleya sp.]